MIALRIRRSHDFAHRLASEYQLHRHARYAALAVSDLADRVRGRHDPGIPPRRSRDFVGGGDFRATGQEFVAHLSTLADLDPADRVLEVGSGIGRIALPLTEVLGESGSYNGLEIVKRGVRWCDANISAAHPNFRFDHADIANGTYNRRGQIPAETYRFPFPQDSFDLAVLTSVFTHLLSPTVEHYLAELERVVAPGGRVLATFFILDEQSEGLMREGRAEISFLHEVGGARVMDEHAPENAVAYPEPYLLDLFERNGFLVRQPIRYGAWSGRADALSQQDIVVARRD